MYDSVSDACKCTASLRFRSELMTDTAAPKTLVQGLDQRNMLRNVGLDSHKHLGQSY